MSKHQEKTPRPDRGPIAWMAHNPVASNLLMLSLLLGVGLVESVVVRHKSLEF